MEKRLYRLAEIGIKTNFQFQRHIAVYGYSTTAYNDRIETPTPVDISPYRDVQYNVLDEITDRAVCCN